MPPRYSHWVDAQALWQQDLVRRGPALGADVERARLELLRERLAGAGLHLVAALLERLLELRRVERVDRPDGVLRARSVERERVRVLRLIRDQQDDGAGAHPVGGDPHAFVGDDAG